MRLTGRARVGMGIGETNLTRGSGPIHAHEIKLVVRHVENFWIATTQRVSVLHRACEESYVRVVVCGFDFGSRIFGRWDHKFHVGLAFYVGLVNSDVSPRQDDNIRNNLSASQ